MITVLASVVDWIVQTVGQLGYAGIIVLMFLESSFFPFPSEVVIPPAGYLAAQGSMNLVLVVISGIAGSLLGAFFNYWLAVRWGRRLFVKYGRYLMVTESSLDKAEAFFQRHGHISMFIGRLLPGIRQYISLPAGMARMNLTIFSLFTAVGATVWVVILAVVGYWFGSNPELTRRYLHKIGIALVVLCAILAAFYAWRIKEKSPMPDQ